MGRVVFSHRLDPKKQPKPPATTHVRVRLGATPGAVRATPDARYERQGQAQEAAQLQAAPRTGGAASGEIQNGEHAQVAWEDGLID